MYNVRMYVCMYVCIHVNVGGGRSMWTMRSEIYSWLVVTRALFSVSCVSVVFSIMYNTLATWLEGKLKG